MSRASNMMLDSSNTNLALVRKVGSGIAILLSEAFQEQIIQLMAGPASVTISEGPKGTIEVVILNANDRVNTLQ